MNKWTMRLIGVILLLLFALIFAQMHSTLRRMQRQQQESGTVSR
jgi:hypothetical protein